ncbi:hypothetical protein HMPREF0542_11145 [Ligilactobacillus ruminis ATCC 25644]|uniref:Uncharacterized protein n=1 Tax=Ligilactobacillus ruminis ATCC 25644 TaxID=525362 RepID=E7FQS0_9LACO|nr:hypothetical protein HMPREF0542_11145 [Ligilactobacillus ruminis ATCC 25644]DAH80516.1 MAG TPA: ECF sigma factor [Caudoviricetes sp.]DAL64467.1 MAG TPA_asm: ECF sigma factor [Caudoviricetes sp.]
MVDWLNTISVKETARNLGISDQKTYNALNRCRKKLSSLVDW